jgi:hypothetical protein
MAQEYDKYEYWNQFDDNSRWRGFVLNEEKMNKEDEKQDDTISMLDYVISQTNYEVHDESSDSEELHQSKKETVAPFYLPCELPNRFSDMNLNKLKTTNHECKDITVVERLNETFQLMKETLK